MSVVLWLAVVMLAGPGWAGAARPAMGLVGCAGEDGNGHHNNGECEMRNEDDVNPLSGAHSNVDMRSKSLPGGRLFINRTEPAVQPKVGMEGSCHDM
jgi:hypothetical protein